jgi:hypothetical protein
MRKRIEEPFGWGKTIGGLAREEAYKKVSYLFAGSTGGRLAKDRHAFDMTPRRGSICGQ